MLRLRNPGLRLPIMPGPTSCAFIHSHEGNIYLLEVVTQGKGAFVYSNATGLAQQFASLHAAKRCARCLGVQHVQLALETPYDQMIGLRSLS
jgi:hypothetical protein